MPDVQVTELGPSHTPDGDVIWAQQQQHLREVQLQQEEQPRKGPSSQENPWAQEEYQEPQRDPLSGRFDSVAFEPRRIYTGGMSDAVMAILKPAADFYGLSVREVREALEHLARHGSHLPAQQDAGETQRPHASSTTAHIFAQAAATSSRRHVRHVFSESELRDPEAVNRARDVLSDIELARAKDLGISEDQRLAGNRAKAFLRKLAQLKSA